LEPHDYSIDPLPYSENHTNHLPGGYDPVGTFKRVELPIADRVITAVGCIVVIAYVALGLWIDDLIIPGFKPHQLDIHVRSAVVAWLLAGAVFCMMIVFLRVYARKSVLMERRSVSEYPGSGFKPIYGTAEKLLRALSATLLTAAITAYVLGI